MQCLLFLLQDWSTYHRLNSNWGVLTAHISCCLSLCYQPCAFQGMAVGRVPGWAASHKKPDTGSAAPLRTARYLFTCMMVEASAYFSHYWRMRVSFSPRKANWNMESGSFFWKRYEGLGSSRELKETMLYTGRKAWPSRQDGEEHLISRNWETGWEEEGCLEKVAFFGLSKHLWIHTSFSINPSLWRETTCRTVWILIFHTFPCKQKHTGMFRHFWYLERNKWEPLAVKLYWHSDIPFSSH